MEVKIELEDMDDLYKNLWSCDDTLDAITENNLEDEFMEELETQFSYERDNGNPPTLTEFNDYVRFDFNLEKFLADHGVGKNEEDDGENA